MVPYPQLLPLLLATVVSCACAAAEGQGPCDIYAAGGTPCVAAYATTRALYGSFNGSLYQVRHVDDNATMDVGVLAPGGVANAASQDAFCGESGGCTISRIYDQSPRGNHLGTAPGGPWYSPFHDSGVNASRVRTTLRGKPVYAVSFDRPGGIFGLGGLGYRNDTTNGIATGDEPETIYMVVSAKHYNNRCCFDFGNAETNIRDDGKGAMEAVSFTNSPGGGFPFPEHKGVGDGPWVMADLENGLWGGNARVNQQNIAWTNSSFVTAMVKGRPTPEHEYALKGGDAQNGGTLRTLFAGPRPASYVPMRKQGAIILGIGGDNSDGAVGTFHEGVMTAGFATDEIDAAVHANIVAAGYGE